MARLNMGDLRMYAQHGQSILSIDSMLRPRGRINAGIREKNMADLQGGARSYRDISLLPHLVGALTPDLASLRSRLNLKTLLRRECGVFQIVRDE